MLDQEGFQINRSAEQTEPSEPSESLESTAPETKPLSKKERVEELRNKALTLQESLDAEPQQRREILAELGYLDANSEKTDEEVEQLAKVATLETMAQAEKIEAGEEDADDDSSDDDDIEETILKETEDENPKLNSHQLAEKMIKDDLKQAFENIDVLWNAIKEEGWDHLHLRTNRDKQLVIMTKQDGKLSPIMTWVGTDIIKHQGLFDIVPFLEQTDHIE